MGGIKILFWGIWTDTDKNRKRSTRTGGKKKNREEKIRLASCGEKYLYKSQKFFNEEPARWQKYSRRGGFRGTNESILWHKTRQKKKQPQKNKPKLVVAQEGRPGLICEKKSDHAIRGIGLRSWEPRRDTNVETLNFSYTITGKKHNRRKVSQGLEKAPKMA